ncbi:MAG: hypothetical protein ABI408_02315 [Gemmatimonadaceae bacterium]
MTEKDPNENHPPARAKPSHVNETQRGWKSKWVESTSSGADDPVDEEEMKGHKIREGGEETT